jgi:hypothetical protein
MFQYVGEADQGKYQDEGRVQDSESGKKSYLKQAGNDRLAERHSNGCRNRDAEVCAQVEEDACETNPIEGD